MYIKRTPSLIFYWELSKNFLGNCLFNTQIDGCFQKRTLLLEKTLWYDKSMWSFKLCVTQERVEGRLTKKVTKNYVGGGFTAKKCDATHSKKKQQKAEIMRVTFFLMPTYFVIFFMSVFVDDVISFLWNK